MGLSGEARSLEDSLERPEGPEPAKKPVEEHVTELCAKPQRFGMPKTRVQGTWQLGDLGHPTLPLQAAVFFTTRWTG